MTASAFDEKWNSSTNSVFMNFTLADTTDVLDTYGNISHNDSSSFLHQHSKSLLIITLLGCVPGTAVNLGTAVMLIRTSSIVRIRDTLLFGVSLADTFSLLTCLAVMSALLTGRWPYGILGCSCYMFGTMLFGTSSILSLLSIAVERLNFLRQLVRRAREQVSLCNLILAQAAQRKYSLLLALVVWLVAFLITTPPMFGWSEYQVQPSTLTCGLNWTRRSASNEAYSIFLAGCVLVVPGIGLVVMAVILVCSHSSPQVDVSAPDPASPGRQRRSSVYKLALRVSRASLASDSSQRSIASISDAITRDVDPFLNLPVSKIIRNERRQLQLVLTGLFAMLLMWFPLIASIIATPYQSTRQEAVVLLSLLARLPTLLNPIITFKLHQPRARTCKEWMCCFFKRTVLCCCAEFHQASAGRITVVAPLQVDSPNDQSPDRTRKRSVSQLPALSPIVERATPDNRRKRKTSVSDSTSRATVYTVMCDSEGPGGTGRETRKAKKHITGAKGASRKSSTECTRL